MTMPQGTNTSVTVIGGGVAGMSAACALAENGFSVRLLERRSYLGGRASSYLHPGVNEIIDNCQHVLFGCCTNLRDFYRRAGVQDKIHWTTGMTMIEPGGRQSRLGPSALPPPLHGMPRLLAASAYSLADKLSLARAFTAILNFDPEDPETRSLGEWLRRHKQTQGAINRFWRLVIASALNADIEEISVPYAAKVVRELFMNSSEAGSMGMSTVPLSRLYDGIPALLRDNGGIVVLGTPATGAAWDEDSRKWTVYSSAGEFASDYLILALPFDATLKLLPHLPTEPGREKLARQIEKHQHWPICSIHLWFDREITNLEHAVLLDREIHWLYNQSCLQNRPGHYVELVVSATRSFAALAREAAIQKAVEDLAEFFPAVRQARLEKVVLIKEVRATFGVPPGIDDARPNEVSPWPNCFLAGDWIQTGWPSTMESAARSGHNAAEAVSYAAQAPCSFLVPDLKPRGLMRWI